MAASDNDPDSPPTVSHVLGEIAWLLTQSPLHRGMAIADLEWLVMPPIIHRQFYVFRQAGRPVGVALWAKCDSAATAKLERGLAGPENRLSAQEWNSGPAVWLVDLIAPFADDENRHREIMIADLAAGPLAGLEFNIHVTDAASGQRRVELVGADVGRRLREELDSIGRGERKS